MLEGIDAHVIKRDDMLIRPGASRRVSFRGTPGGRVSIRAGAKHGPGLADPLEPVDDGPNISVVTDLVARPLRALGVATAPPPRRAPGRSPVELAAAKRDLIEAILSDPDTPGEVEPAGEEEPGETRVTFLAANNPFHRPSILTHGRFGDIVIVGPEEPPDIDRPTPRPPLDVRVATRGGAMLNEETLTSEFPFLAMFTSRSFPDHDVIDVTFSNPNAFPILVLTFLNVQNDVKITETRLTETLLNRVFSNTLLFLAPTISVRDGKLRFALPKRPWTRSASRPPPRISISTSTPRPPSSRSSSNS